MVIIFGQRGATSWGFQIGRLCLDIVYPRYWLYGRTPGYGRTWFYNTPVRLTWERD